MPLEEVPCSSPRLNSQRAHNAVCPLENYVLNFHRFLGPNFASVRAAAFCGWIASDDAHGHVVFPSRLQARIIAIVSKRLACVISRVPAHSIARSREALKPMKPSSAARRRGPPLQRWLTFLRNHAPNIAAMEMFVFRPSDSTRTTSWPSSGWGAGSLSGSKSHRIQLRRGSHPRSQRHSLGMRLRAT